MIYADVPGSKRSRLKAGSENQRDDTLPDCADYVLSV